MFLIAWLKVTAPLKPWFNVASTLLTMAYYGYKPEYSFEFFFLVLRSFV